MNHHIYIYIAQNASCPGTLWITCHVISLRTHTMQSKTQTYYIPVFHQALLAHAHILREALSITIRIMPLPIRIALTHIDIVIHCSIWDQHRPALGSTVSFLSRSLFRSLGSLALPLSLSLSLCIIMHYEPLLTSLWTYLCATMLRYTKCFNKETTRLVHLSVSLSICLNIQRSLL